jgi:hypothetical protein
MKENKIVRTLCTLLFLLVFDSGSIAEVGNSDEASAPHTPALIFYLSGADNKKDIDAIRHSLEKLKSATLLEVNTNRSYARVRFDSHVVSYHQVAQTISEAGETLSKHYDPRLKITIPEYAQDDNASRVDAVFAGKRLNQRVTVVPVDKAKGLFSLHFLPLAIDATNTNPQGFNGGHLNHPIHDPPPRGLGLKFSYAEDDNTPTGTNSPASIILQNH